MNPETSPDSLAIPPALLAEVKAEADKEHRPAADLLRDLVERGLAERRRNRVARKVSEMTSAELEAIGKVEMDARHNHLDAEQIDPAKLTPAEAVARILKLREGNILPEGVTIRDMMAHGRA